MQELRSWLAAAASRAVPMALGLGTRANLVFQRVRSRFPTALDVRLLQKLASGATVVLLVLLGYAYGPVVSRNAEATASGGATAQQISSESREIVIAQATPAAKQKPATQGAARPAAPKSASSPVAPAKSASTPPAAAAPAVSGISAPDLSDAWARIPVLESADPSPLTPADFETAGASEPASRQATAPAAEKPESPAPTADLPDSAPKPTARPQNAPNLTGKELVNAPLAENLSAADAAVAERLRELVALRLGRFLDRRDLIAGVEAFYRDRGFAPLWIANDAANARADATIRYLRSVHEDGLEPADYAAPSIGSGMTPQALAEAELTLTGTVLTFVRHASIGRVHYSRAGSEIEYSLVIPEAGGVLARIAGASDVAAALAAYQPRHPQYVALKAKLAELRKNPQQKQTVRIPDGATLRVGSEDSRVPLLRARLNIPGDRNNRRFDEAVATAVKEFQHGAGLAADGLVGPATLLALNGPGRANSIDIVIVNLDRWRWMPRELGEFYSMVNIPDFSIRVVHNGKLVWQTKTVVGRPSRQTPLISDQMKFITVNPTWNVPPGIVANDYLPALHQDPSSLDRIGVKIEQNRDGTFRMYQPPGDNNALGRLRFNFPNKFLVYQHDTPDKHLFQRDARAYSSGCMRVENPPKYAELLLSYALPNERYTQDRIRAMYGPEERTINFARPVPVHLTYQTAFVDDSGTLQIRDDVYGYDEAMIAVLKGRDRQVADVAIHRPRQQIAREELRLPPGFEHRYGYRFGGYGSTTVEEFFRRFFR